jgi:hypothetical protein
VSISEVREEVMDWENASPFFLAPEPETIAPAHAAHLAPTPAPSAAQMDEAELLAQLTLNERNADTGEQIEIRRTGIGVEVGGLVESAGRKKELNDSLAGIPFLTAKIQSFDDLTSTASPTQQTHVIQQRTVLATISPLEQHFVEHGRSRDDLSRISAALLHQALAINQLSRAIEQTTQRFSNNTVLSAAAIQARDQILERNTTRLLEDLKQQQRLLDETGLYASAEEGALRKSETNGQTLAGLAQENMVETRELVSGDSETSSSSKELVQKLGETILRLHQAAAIFIPSQSKQP